MWRGLTQKMSSSMAEHKWKNTELYHTYLCPPYFSNCWELRSAGEQTIVHWWHTVCHPSMISILEAARPAQSASMKGENHAVSFCSPDLPQPPPFQDPRQHLNSWQIFLLLLFYWVFSWLCWRDRFAEVPSSSPWGSLFLLVLKGPSRMSPEYPAPRGASCPAGSQPAAQAADSSLA